MFREWGNIKNALVIYIIIQLVCVILSILLPGIGQILAIAFNIYLFFRPVSFYKNISTGFILFFLWIIGLNRILGNFILEDPRGVLTGDVFITVTDWVILVLLIIAFVRAIYHAIINYRFVFLNPDNIDKEKYNLLEGTFKDDSQVCNKFLTKKEGKTGKLLLLISVIAVVISLQIQPGWQKQAINDLNAAFSAIAGNDLETARSIAQKYYNDERFLFNGDVFFLNAIVREEQEPLEAIRFFIRASSWYDNHRSWISEDFHGESYYRLSKMYLNSNPPDFYRARNAIQNAVKVDSDNIKFNELQIYILEHVSRFEERENIRFFRRFWNNLRARF